MGGSVHPALAACAAAATIAAAGCAADAGGASPAARRAAIVNGEADPYDFGVVALSFGGSSFCTGTVVSPHIVVTAAHCVDPAEIPDMWIKVGEHAASGVPIPVVDGVVHAEYDGGSNDIALLVLAAPAPVRPWPVNRTAFDASWLGREVRLVGYGVTDPNGGGGGRKREGIAAISNFDALDFAYASAPAQTCFGDSGGPAFVLVDGVEVLAGVTSRGDADCAEIGIDTRVDVYADWIDTYVALYEDADPACDADGLCAANCGAPDPDCPCEADGVCSDACDALATDRDCPPHCDYDGVCEAAEDDCPAPDRDCHPTQAVGEPCEFDTSCIDGACIGGVDDPRATYCSTDCSTDGDCPADMFCGDGVCRYEAPSPGAQGWPCTADSECVEELCVVVDDDTNARICANKCAADSDCGDGDTCQRARGGAVRVCLPQPGGCGCRAGDTPPFAGALAFACAVALGLSRRSRACPRARPRTKK
ncbi:MAG: hypothetical protein D6689_22430 [Deltaproteobacteria bacterium]|nr:MAG: hypothetical protein D6689_22430 [Deltaproteobacteria bacterium]